MPITLDFQTSQSAEIAAVFGLLSRLWATELDAKTIGALRQKPLADIWKQLGGALPADDSKQAIEDLAVDYCQLLIGPKNHVPPVQSVWSQAKLSGESTASMQKYIDMLEGFQPSDDFIDHVAVQLQYAATVLGMAEQTKPKLVLGLATAFANDHLLWTEKFFLATEAKATTEFYGSLSKVSREFLFAQ